MKLLTKLSNRQSYRRIIASLLTYVMFFNTFVSVTIAGPEGAQVINGQVSIQQSGSNTAITASDKAIINYSSFDIARPETVQFIQPGSNASVLNRILSANPTNINGTLLANGRVFFVNPAGVYIGDGARINVNQFVASALNISNSDFINGNYNFAGGNGAVINDGDISAEQVYLIGKQVTNSGNISCPAGYVVMAAGDRVFLGEPGSDIVLDVEGTSLSGSADAATSETGVLNEGEIEAAGGIIALAAAGDIYSQALSNVGSLSTSVDTGDGGQIKLAAAGGTVTNSGSIEATSESGAGGTVQMLGDKVGLLDAAGIDVSGSDGGGTVLVGGDYQGGANIPIASRTYVSENSTIKADATENGDGGKVIVWADELTGFYGNISARGGNKGGDGGFVEVSGKENLGFYGSVDTSAPNGNIGTLLLDPTNIVVSNTDGTDGASGGDILFADAPAVEPWNVTPDQLNTVAADILLQADEDITFTDSVSLTTNGAGITAQAGDDILVNSSITTQGGSLVFTANDNINGTASGDGSIVLNAALDTTANSQTGGAVTLTVEGGTGDIQLGDNITTNTANITFEGPVTLTADSALSTTASVGGDISFDSDVSGDQLLTLAAGTGNIDFLSTVGGTTHLSGLLVNSAATVDLDNTVDLDDEGLSITTGAIVIDNTVSITNGGSFSTSGSTFDNTGGDITTDGGYVTLVHTGDVTVGAEIQSNDGNITVSSSAGNIMLGDIITADDGTVVLAAENITVADNSETAEIVTNGSVNLTANAITGSGSHNLDIQGATALTINDTGTGNISIDEVTGSTITSTSITVADAASGDIDIAYNNGDSVDINTGHVLNDIDLDQSVSSFSYTAITGDISIDTINTGTKDISITATAGAINEDGTPDGSVDITCNALTLTAQDEIGGAFDIETDVASLDASSTAAGDIVITETDGITLTNVGTANGAIIINTNGATVVTNVAASGGGDEDDVSIVTSGGDITLGVVSAAGSGDVTIQATTGSINETGTGDAAVDITGDLLTLTAQDEIGGVSELDIETTAASLNVSSTSAGDIVITETDGINLTDVDTADGAITINTGGATVATDVAASGSSDEDDVTIIASAGDVTLGTVSAAGSGDVTIQAVAGSINEIGVGDIVVDISGDALILTAQDEIGGPVELDIETTAASLDASSTTAGDIVITETDGIILTNVDTANGAIIINTNGATIVIDVAASGGGDEDDVSIVTSGGDVTLGVVSAAGSGDVTIQATTGSINETGTGNAAVDIISDALILSAQDEIGGAGELDVETTVTSLEASSTNGDIVLTETDNVVLGDIEAIAGNVVLQATNGTMTHQVGKVITAGGNSLSMKSDGDLNMANFTVVNPGSTNLILDSTGGSAIVTGSAADDWLSITAAAQYNVVLSGDGDITTGNLESRSTSGLNGVQINTDTGSGGSLDAQGTITSGGFVTVDVEGSASFDQPISAEGKVELTAKGDITTNAISSTAGNIEILSTGGDLIVEGSVNADANPFDSIGGGVSLISETGKIYTPDGLTNDTLNVDITGYSKTSEAGVNLPFGPGKTAILIMSNDDLKLGTNTSLTANGEYSISVDDRPGVGFDVSPSVGGEPIDIAIYLGNYWPALSPADRDIEVNSLVSIADYGTMVIDAGEKVTFGSEFNESRFYQTNRLEVVSRISKILNEVIGKSRLPYAKNPEAIRDWFNETPTGYFAGAYVLRGAKIVLAEVLDFINPVPLVPPRPLELEVRGEVERPDTEALENLLSELGIGIQPYVTDAYAASLSTDLRLYSAAEKLQRLIPILEDADGTRIAGLRTAVAQFFPSLDVLSEELMDSFAQELTRHKGDGTDYDLAGQCIFALTEYVNTLGTDIGWPVEKSVGFVMGRYVPRLTEGDEIRIAVIQMQLQKALGVGV